MHEPFSNTLLTFLIPIKFYTVLFYPGFFKIKQKNTR